jgi:uncharacterized protein (DUF2342 family)
VRLFGEMSGAGSAQEALHSLNYCCTCLFSSVVDSSFRSFGARKEQVRVERARIAARVAREREREMPPKKTAAAGKAAKGAAAAVADADVAVAPVAPAKVSEKPKDVGAALVRFLAGEEDGAFEEALLEALEKVKRREMPAVEVVALLKGVQFSPEMGAANAAVVSTLWLCGSQVSSERLCHMRLCIEARG